MQDIAVIGMVSPVVGRFGAGNFHFGSLTKIQNADECVPRQALIGHLSERALVTEGGCATDAPGPYAVARYESRAFFLRLIVRIVGLLDR
jgi:hypothetical protein